MQIQKESDKKFYHLSTNRNFTKQVQVGIKVGN